MNCPKCKGKMNITYEGATYTLYKCLCGFEEIAYRGEEIRNRLNVLEEKHNKSLIHISDQIKKLEVEIEALEEKVEQKASGEKVLDQLLEMGKKIEALEEKLEFIDEIKEIIEKLDKFRPLKLLERIEAVESIFKKWFEYLLSEEPLSREKWIIELKSFLKQLEGKQ